jgi:hypothetical protein
MLEHLRQDTALCHGNEYLLSQTPFRETFGDSRVFLLGIAEREAWRSVMKPGYPIHERVRLLGMCRYRSMRRVLEVLVGGTGR